MTTLGEIFPRVLVRVAGESFNRLGSDEKTAAIKNSHEELFKLETIETELRKKVCDDLYKLIGNLESVNQQKLLLNFKRDLFNKRNSKIGTQNKVLEYLPPNILHDIGRINAYDDEIKNIRDNINHSFFSIVKRESQTIHAFCQSEKFKRGLLLASKELYDEAKSYEISGNIRSVDIGLWKYITRFVSKTSPFSTFTNLSIANVTDNFSQIISLPESNHYQGVLRYNNIILQVIFEIFKQHPKLRSALSVRNNPTINLKDGSFYFLTNSCNVECFQKISNNSILDCIFQYLSKAQNPRFGEVVDMLSEQVDSDLMELNYYLFELIQTGIFEFDFSISGIDCEWDQSLLEYIKIHLSEVTDCSEYIRLLERLIKIRLIYANALTDERETLLIEILSLFSLLLYRLHEDAGMPEVDRMNVLANIKDIQKKYSDRTGYRKNFNFVKGTTEGEITNPFFLHKNDTQVYLPKRNLFYEDTITADNGEISREHLESFVRKLNMVIQSFSVVCNLNFEYSEINKFCIENIPVNTTISVLDLYKRYYEYAFNKGIDHSKPSEREIEKVRRHYEHIYNCINAEHMKSTLSHEDNVCSFNATLLEKIGNNGGNYDYTTNKSYGSLVQFFLEKGADGRPILKGVTNAILPGYGKLMTRFLHLFEDELSSELLDWNNKLFPNEIVAENLDASFFNANLHPPITHYEVKIPGGNNRVMSDKQISVSDIYLKRNESSEQVDIYYKDGTKMHVLDLGFQGIKGRSNLYRLLCSFGDNNYFHLPGISKVFDSYYMNTLNIPGTTEKCFVYPRLEFDQTVVLQRKKWVLPCNSLLNNCKKFTPESFVHLNKIRMALQIPDYVFVTARNTNSASDSQHVKPQYIDFFSPISLQLLIKLAKPEVKYFEIEEMLPQPNQLLGDTGHETISECLIQWRT